MPERPDAERRSRRGSPWRSRPARALAALLFVSVLLALDAGFARLVPDGALRQLVLLAGVNAIVALSLNVINGMAGQFSIGHAGFLALGAYSSALVASHLEPLVGPPGLAASFVVVPIALAASALVTALAGLVVGLPSLRLRGDYLAVVTLGFAEIVRLTLSSVPGEDRSLVEAWRAAGEQGGLGIGHALAATLGTLGGQNGYAGPDDAGVPLYAGPFWVFGLAGLAAVLAVRLKESPWGRALRALREDEIAASAVGIDPTRFKVLAFVISAVGGGVAGGLLAMQRDGTPLVQPDAFGFQTSFDAVIMVVIGGSGSVSGALLGSLLVTFTLRSIELLEGTSAVAALRTALPGLDTNAVRMVLYALVLVTSMIARPQGLLGERELRLRARPRGRAEA